MIHHVKTALQIAAAALLLAATACASAPQAPARESFDNAPREHETAQPPPGTALDSLPPEPPPQDGDSNPKAEEATDEGATLDDDPASPEPTPETEARTPTPPGAPAPRRSGTPAHSRSADGLPAGKGANRGWGGALDGDTTSASSTAKRPMNVPAAESRDVCLQDCMDRNQKRAVDAQTLAADCKAECDEP